MSTEEKSRSSADAARDPAKSVLPTVNPEALKSAPEPASFHPAVYIATWITLSSSTIVFNKYILDTAKFRRRHHLLRHPAPLLTRPQSFPFSSQHGTWSLPPS